MSAGRAAAPPRVAVKAATGDSRVVVPSFSSSRYASNAAFRLGSEPCSQSIAHVSTPGRSALCSVTRPSPASGASRYTRPSCATWNAAGVKAALPTTSRIRPANAERSWSRCLSRRFRNFTAASSTCCAGIPHFASFTWIGSTCHPLFFRAASRSAAASDFHVASLPRSPSKPACSCRNPGNCAISWRVSCPRNGAPTTVSRLPNVSSPESICMGANDPSFGVPSINSRAPVTFIIRSQVFGRSSCIVRATSPPIECAMQPHRLASALARIEGRVDRVCQEMRRLLDRAAPVESKRRDVVVARKKSRQIIVEDADRAIGGDAVLPALCRRSASRSR